LGVERTSATHAQMSASDPKRTFNRIALPQRWRRERPRGASRLGTLCIAAISSLSAYTSWASTTHVPEWSTSGQGETLRAASRQNIHQNHWNWYSDLVCVRGAAAYGRRNRGWDGTALL
jgi:hypothetical protein